jgi:hypothetical protein
LILGPQTDFAGTLSADASGANGTVAGTVTLKSSAKGAKSVSSHKTLKIK